jgi:hypothetical protein
MSIFFSNDTLGNRARDLPVCSAVSQPSVPPRAQDSDSYETECNASRAKDEEVLPRPQSPKSIISQISSCPDFYASTSEDEDALQIVAGQQSELMQWTLPFPLEGV